MTDRYTLSRVLTVLMDRLDQLALGIAALCVALFSAIVIYVACARYLFDTTPYWAEELPRSLLVWAVFIGLIPATHRGIHLNAGLLPLLVRDNSLRRLLQNMAKAMTALFLLVLAYTGTQLTEAGLDSLTTALQIPNAVVYAALPIGAGLSALTLIVQLLTGRAP